MSFSLRWQNLALIRERVKPRQPYTAYTNDYFELRRPPQGQGHRRQVSSELRQGTEDEMGMLAGKVSRRGAEDAEGDGVPPAALEARRGTGEYRRFFQGRCVDGGDRSEE